MRSIKKVPRIGFYFFHYHLCFYLDPKAEVCTRFKENMEIFLVSLIYVLKLYKESIF